MNWPKVGVVIVNHDQQDLLKACLDSWLLSDYPDLTLLVSDNGSKDGTRDMLARDYPGVKLLAHDPEIGFAAAATAGLNLLAREHELLLLTTNDTLVEKDMLRHLVAAALADPNAAVLGPKILYEADRRRIWFGGGYFHRWLGHAYHASFGATDRAEDEPVPCHFITGCCFLTRRDPGQRYGFLRPELGFVAEDTDYCSRLRRDGYKVFYVPRARMVHRISATLSNASPMVSYYGTRNGLAQVWRNREGFWPLSALAYTLIQQPRYALGQFKRQGWAATANLRAMLLGARDFVLGNYGLRDPKDPARPFKG